MKAVIVGSISPSIHQDIRTITFKEGEQGDIYLIGETEDILSVLLKLRGDPKTTLNPVFLLENENIDEYIQDLIDGPWQDEKSLKKAEKILTRIRSLPALSEHLAESEKRLVTFFRFLWSREREEVKAYPDSDSRVGYTYPLLRACLKLKAGDEIDYIEQLLSQGLIREKKLVNRIPVCPNDHTYQIIFRETCPNCGSLKLQETDLYYHFDCGYVGPKEEFTEEDILRCPKCQRRLRHLGEDYEIPNNVFLCRDCQHITEEPKIEIFCLHCKKTYGIESLVFYEIKDYLISALGIETAQEGRLPLRGIEEIFDKLNLIKWNVFKFIFDWEKNRFKRYKQPFSLLLISWDNEKIEEIFEEYGTSKIKQYFEEVIVFLKQNLRTTDIGCRYNLGTFLFLLPNTPGENAKIVQNRLFKDISKIETDIPIPPLKIEIYSCPGEAEKLTIEEIITAEYD